MVLKESSVIRWMYGSQEVVDIPDGMVGFVYIITYVDGTYYVGKKLARSLRKKKPLKGMRKNARRMVMVEHKWREYEGSSAIETKSEILNKDILYWCSTARAMTFLEAETQFKLRVLQDKKSLNGNILGKFFRNVLETE